MTDHRNYTKWQADRKFRAIQGITSRVAFLGDSITQSGWQTSSQLQGSSFPLFAMLQAGGRIVVARNAGIAGDRSDQALARFDTDVTPYVPRMVHILLGTNDVIQGVSFASYKANIREIVNACRRIQAVPVLGAIPPNNGAGRSSVISQWNAWLRALAAYEGLPFIDYFELLLNDTNGQIAASYDSGDGTHPSTSGYVAMGQLCATALQAVLPPWQPHLLKFATDTSARWSNNPLLTADANADGVPDGWTAYGGTSGFAHTLVTDSAVHGKMMKVTQTANASLRGLQRGLSGTFTPGDVISMAGIITSNGGVSADVRLTFTGPASTSRPVSFTAAITRGFFYQELTVPASTTGIVVDVLVGAGTGEVSVGQLTPMNLTADGLV